MNRHILTLALLLSPAAPTALVAAQGEGMPAPSVMEVRDEAASMVDRIGATVDPSLAFTDERGYPFQLKQLFPGERPVILLLGYYSCPAMCGQVLDATLRSLNRVDLEPSKDYYLLNVSIDPRETAETAKDRKNNFLSKFAKLGAADGWRVCVGDEQNIRMLADTVGFQYYWSEHANQYAHPPAVIVLTPKGVVSRVLVNTEFEPADLRLALIEASQGTLGTLWDKVRLNCLTFDSRTSTYTLTAMTLMRIGGAVTVIALAAMILIMLRKERRKAGQTEPAHA
ncbi:MAG: SCO family protein [Planctomycetes bacterium]|nr:SCO family protein [Planctomycetota bacterium]